MKLVYSCSYLADSDKLSLSLVAKKLGNLSEVAKAKVVVKNKAILDRANDLITFPVEEMDYGLYGKDLTDSIVESVLTNVVAQAEQQISRN